MGFDAGSIEGQLTLDRTDFDEGLEQAKADAQEFEDKGITVPLKMETEEFDEDAADAEETKTALEEPIEIPASIDNEELAASAVEAEAIIDAVKESAADTGVGSGGGLLSFNPGNMEGEAAQVKALINDISTSAAEATNGEGLVQMMLGSGATGDELTAGLRNLGFGAGEAASMISAAQLVDAILPSSEAIALEGQERLNQGFYQLMSGPSDPISTLYSLLAGEKTIAGSYAPPEQLTLPSGLGNIARGASGAQAALGPGAPVFSAINDVGDEAEETATSFSTLRYAVDSGGVNLAGALLNSGETAETLGPTLAQMGFKAEQVASILGQLGISIEDDDSGGSGVFAAMFKAASGATDSIDDLIDDIPLIKGGLPGLLAGIPAAGGLGLAAGGAVAGTSIGLAGTAWALIPGLIDLLHGYTAYSDQKALAAAAPGSTAAKTAYAAAVTNTSGSESVGSAIGNIIGGGDSVLGGLENQINPQIVTFLNSYATALQSVAPFAQSAVTSMGHFFSTIDKGMTSSGFKSFMDQMTKDVGPIMDEFGGTIINLGKAFGDFLSIFGGAPAQMVGTWFETETGKLDDFLKKAHITPDFMAGAKLVFDDLSKAIDAAWEWAKKLAEGFAPIGLAILKVAGPVLTFTGLIGKMIPPHLITAIAGVVGGLWALNAVIGVVEATTLADVILDVVVVAILALTVGIYELATHWRESWTDIKNWFDDAVTYMRSSPLITWILSLVGPMVLVALHWQAIWADMQSWAGAAWAFIDGDVIQPLVNFFTTAFGPAIQQGENIWNTVWGGITRTIQAAWGIISPIAHDIASVVSTITGAIGDVGSFLSGSSSDIAQIAALGKIAQQTTTDLNPFAPKALGGSFDGSNPLLVGENGPEMIFPRSAGYVVPNNRLSFSGSPSTAGITINIDASGASDVNATRSAVQAGVNASLPALRAALERGSGSMAGVG